MSAGNDPHAVDIDCPSCPNHEIGVMLTKLELTKAADPLGGMPNYYRIKNATVSKDGSKSHAIAGLNSNAGENGSD